jgi:menaquinone-dependent protoporphyrinogen IX oxidase
MDEKILEEVYQERLEERIINYLAKDNEILLEEAMDIYYNSRLAEKIHEGKEGIQYLDHKVLVQILKETESELFAGKQS